jgi:hypothetical protein
VEELPVRIQGFTSDIAWDHETGWLIWRHATGREISLCWLPTERRGSTFSVRDYTVAIGTNTGIVTILDLTGTIALLRKLGVIDQDDTSH